MRWRPDEEKRAEARLWEVRSIEPVTNERRLLLNVAYRMLGSLSDAEDVVQDSYARWYALPEAQRRDIASPTGWLVRVTSRLCLDVLRSARVRRERYVGTWLPEPLPDDRQWRSPYGWDTARDPADRVSLDESVSMALLVVLEHMTPAERVAFVLHDVFQYPFKDIAEIVGRTPQACRQLASSARQRIGRPKAGVTPSGGPPGRPRVPGAAAEVVGAFRTAWQTGDLAGLIASLDPDAQAIGDGGGLVGTILDPLDGSEKIARFFLDVVRRRPDLIVDETSVNGQPGLIAHAGGVVEAVVAMDVRDGRIADIWVMRNPGKLVAWREWPVCRW